MPGAPVSIVFFMLLVIVYLLTLSFTAGHRKLDKKEHQANRQSNKSHGVCSVWCCGAAAAAADSPEEPPPADRRPSPDIRSEDGTGENFTNVSAAANKQN